jgi:hypothetical protein
MKPGSRLALAAALLAAPAGAEVRGVWTAEPSRWRVSGAAPATLLQLSLRGTRGSGEWSSSQPVPLGELHGLGAQQLSGAPAEVRFEWRRDAGAFAFEGRFQDQAGAGHFRFTASADFVAELRSRGQGAIDEEKALSLAIHDVSRSFIAELEGLGYRKLTLDQLVAFRIHGVTPEFIRAFRGMGYEALAAEQLVAMRIHGVTPEFAADLGKLGYGAVPVEELVAMRIHGVTTAFVRRVQQQAGKGVSIENLVSMRIHGEDAE